MSKDLDRLLQANEGSVEVRKAPRKHPKGFEPGITIRADGGAIVTEPLEDEPHNWEEILDQLLPPNIDRSKYAIDTTQPVELRAWDGNIGNGEIKRLYYFKARIKMRVSELERVDIDDIIKVAKKAKRSESKQLSTSPERCYFLQITDLQAGQADGQGVEGMVSKALELGAIAKADIATLKKSGRPVDQVFIPITGDLVEGVSGWYETQLFSVQLDRREQVKLVRRLLTEVILDIASLGLPIHVAVVPGNHGENRSNGKAYTTLSDNDDVAVIEQIAEAFALANVDNVTFSFPSRDRLSLTVEVLGWVVGLSHGHVARAAGAPSAKILNWFKSMAAIKDPIGDSEILFTGHYHHGVWSQLVGNLEWIQGGALCDASAWFEQTSGLVSDPLVMKGTITRHQKIESLMPYRWPRTRVASREIPEA